MPFDLAIRILGGEGANRLFGVLRSDRGLTYGASADLNAFRTAGDVMAETDTRSSATGESLRLMVDEFVRLQRESVHPAELRGAQDFMAGNFPLTIETLVGDRGAGAGRTCSSDWICRDRDLPRSRRARVSRPTFSVSRASCSSRTSCRSCSSATRRPS